MVVSIAGALVLFVVVVWVVVVVAGVGCSTTVVQDVNSKATAKSGMRMISFFIVGIWFPSQTYRCRCLNQTCFPTPFPKQSLLTQFSPCPQLFGARTAPF